MVIKRSKGEKVFNVVNIFIMLIMIFVSVYPFIHVLFASLSDSNKLIMHRGMLLHPLGFNLNAYKLVFKNPNILSGYSTTLFVLVVGTSLNILMTSIGAFLLSRKKFPIRNFLMVMVVITMYISGGMIPRYLLIYNGLELGDSLLSLILPNAISAWNLIVMRTNFMQVPDSLEESAKIDGANDIIILFRIIIPLSMATIAVMVLFYGVTHWNAWFDAMLFLRSRNKYPLQLIMREILILNSTDSMMQDISSDRFSIGESIKYATIVVSTVPILLVYPFIQKYFVKGVMVGALKG